MRTVFTANPGIDICAVLVGVLNDSSFRFWERAHEGGTRKSEGGADEGVAIGAGGAAARGGLAADLLLVPLGRFGSPGPSMEKMCM